MPFEVEGPDGKVHTFPDGTPPDQINSQMSGLYGSGSLNPVTPPKPAMAPMAPGQLPPGTTPGRIVAQETAPDASMVPLSVEAQRAQRMLPFFGMMGDRAGVSAAQDMLNSDPTYQARQAQAKQMGTNAGQLSAKQQAGARVYEAVNELEQKAKAWAEHAPSAFNGGIGPIQSGELYQTVQGALPMIGNRGAQAFTTSMHHDIDKLVALYREMPSTGASSGSDAQDANFKEAMGQWLKAPDPATLFAVLQSAKGLVRNKAGLPPDFDLPRRPLDPTDVAAINHYAQKPITPDSPYVTGKAPQPPQDIDPSSVPAGQTFIFKGHKIKALGNDKYQRL